MRSRCHPAFVLLVVAIPAILAACGSSSSSSSTSTTSSASSYVGLGSSLASWQAAYGVMPSGSNCSGSNCNFGPALTNTSSGATYRFSGVDFMSGRATDYQMNFSDGSSYSSVMRVILKTLPSDVVVNHIVIDHVGGSCGLVLVHSVALGKALGAPQIGDSPGVANIKLSSSTDSAESYSATNIQTAYVIDEEGNPTSSC